jgi:tetratricopeptide (TPR) repeat protein
MILRVFFIGCLLAVLSPYPGFSATRQASPILLPCRPIDAGAPDGKSKNQWLAALIDRQIRFKLEPVSGIRLANEATVEAALPALHNYRVFIDEREFAAIAPTCGATRILKQKFEFIDHGKTVNYYAEMVQLPAGATISQTERDIPADRISSGIDTCLSKLLSQAGIELTADASRFLLMPVTGASLRSVKELGEIIIREYDSTVNKKTLAFEYEKLSNHDPYMLLANYGGGMLYFGLKDYEKSAHYIKEVLDLSPNHPALYLTLARSYRLSGKYNEALQVAMACEQGRLRTVPFLLEKAYALEGLLQSQMAFSVYQQILMLDPKEPAALLFLARTRNDERNYAEGKLQAARLLSVDNGNALAHYEYGRALFGLGKYKEAEQEIITAERLRPEDPGIQELLGDVSMINRQFTAACGHYQRASVMRPRELEIFLKTATALESDGKKEEALKQLYDIAGRFPAKPELRRQIGLLEYANGIMDSACRSLTMYLAVKPDDGVVLQTLGTIYLRKENYRKAQDYYEKSLPQAADKIACKLALADIELHKKQPVAAMTILREIIREKPVASAHGMMGDALLMGGSKQDALKEYRTEYEMHGNNPAIQEKIGRLNYELGFYIPSRKAFEQLLAVDPKHAGACYYLALLSLRSNDAAAAGSYMSKAEALGTGTPEIYFEAGTLYRSRNLPDRAIKAYGRCLGLTPEFEPALRDLADCQLSVGNDTAAAALNIRLFNLDNKAYSARLAQAGHLYRKHDLPKEASAAYRLFIDKGFSDFTVNIGYATICYQKKDYAKVITMLEKIDGQYQREPETVLMLCDAYCQTSQYAKALPWLDKVRRITTDIKLEARLSAVAAEKTGDTMSAIPMYVRMLSFPPDDNRTEDAYHLGTLYEAKKLIENAIARYEKNISESPDDLRSHERLSAIYLQRREWPNAQRVLETAMAFPHVTVIIQKMLAQTYAATGENEKAADLFSKYLAKVKDDCGSWKELAAIYYSQKKYAEAIKPLTQVTALNPSDFDGWYKLGASYAAVENFTAAVAPLGRARALNPKSIPAIELSAKSYRHLRETSTLASILREWIALDPKRYDIKMELGSILLEEKEITEATAMLNDAVRFIPTDAAPHLLLAKAYELQANDSLRLLHLNAALKFSPDAWEPHFQIARYFLAKKQLENAETHLQKTVAINPMHAGAHFEYGVLLCDREEFGAADTQFRLAVETDPKNALYQAMLAYTESRTGKERDALSRIASSVVTTSANAQVAYRIGLVYKQCNRTDQARESYSRALGLDSSCAACLEALGDIFMEEIRFKDAAQHYFRAWEKGGYNAKRVYKLGNALLYDRKYVEAKDFFETILSKDTAYDGAKYRLAVAYCELGDLKKARALIPTFRNIGTPWMQLAQGKIYETENNTDAALAAYSIARRIAPDHPEVSAGLGRTYLQRKVYDSAIVYLSTASAADTLNMQAMMDLGTIFDLTGDPSSALQYYLEVDKKYPWYPGVQLRIAEIKASQNAHEIALRYLARGITYQPADTGLYILAGQEYAAIDNYKEALESYKIALKKGKGKPVEVLRQIGNIYYDKLADSKKAREYYKKYVKAGGSMPEVTQRLAGI